MQAQCATVLAYILTTIGEVLRKAEKEGNMKVTICLYSEFYYLHWTCTMCHYYILTSKVKCTQKPAIPGRNRPATPQSIAHDDLLLGVG